MISPLKNHEDLDTRFFIEQSNGLNSITEILPDINPSALPLLLVYDENTKKAAGDAVRKILGAKQILHRELLLVPGGSKIVTAEYSRVEDIKEAAQRENAYLVAVGSGTINDLVKRAAFEMDRSYLCIPTASSVDGYSSVGAALVKDGYKTTLPCPPPVAIIADPDILKEAPYGMTASGYGDLYSKFPAGVDWILADRLGIEPIDQESWSMVQDDLASWLSSPQKLKDGDPAAFAGLFRGLTMSGFAMQVYKDSRPASGAEHMISHIWEMAHLSRDGIPFSHGFKVSVGTVLVSSLMEMFFTTSFKGVSVDDILKKQESWEQRAASIGKHFPDPGLKALVEDASKSKWTGAKDMPDRIGKIISLLPELNQQFKQRVGSAEKVISDLRSAGCPVSFREFGLTREDAADAIFKAQMTRERYTVLDAIYEVGLLPELIERVCGKF